MCPRSRLRLTSVLAAGAMLAAAAVPAAAAPPSSGLEEVGRTVSDEALGTMRGKFIGPENIAYFGVQMQTSWQGQDGVTTSATLLFTINFANGTGDLDGATPMLLIGWSREGDPSADLAGFGDAAASQYVAIPVGGLGSAQGAVQTQQIEGSDNVTRNNMQVAVVPMSALQNGQVPAGLTPVTAGQSHGFEDGDRLQFVVAPGQIGLVLSGSAGAEQVRQGLDGGLGQASQHILLSSNGNMADNNMGIVVGYDQLDQASRVSLDNALSTLKGVGF